ncbi:YfgM family protein [Arenicella xantha]|uniref:Putative negative regulator of RcsB-dependent stress response n=1 Tax=Arenicella xantha TaxID=644221 RepID=A0A395JK64_9GAMM|nr:tetratricopeptide repeat protein [Arenicella xantha]RBP49292.1 putative negative regulator of RcsB-dependent stress response [Arenicella xantha]
MADDIFLTPEEQDERARQWLKDNGPALVIGIALGLGAIFGWDYYKKAQLELAEGASAVYAETLESVQSSELADISAQVDTLKQDYSGTSYAAKAVLIRAKQLALSDMAAAYDELQWVIDNSDESGLQHTARLRQAKIKLAQGELAAAKALASHQPTQGFTSNYAEILGDIAVQEGDLLSARVNYQTSIDALSETQAAYAQVLSIKLDRLPNNESAEVTSADADSGVE